MNAAALRSKRDRQAALPSPRRPEFVEVALPLAMGGGECVLELETARGGKLRLELKAMPVAALAQLVRAVAE
jgi:hypothetical protein